MPLECLLVLVLFIAIGALSKFVRMDQLVSSAIVFAFESFPANTAQEWPFCPMSVHVSFKIGFMLKFLLANWTFGRFYITVTH